ncbi:MAG: 3-oxoacyl-ACP reductase [Chloroflexi bacterium]|nr:3-oxoacyl-ACP reductase [Chloroflexota bacterium]|tara:strand:- start:6049 stop:6903 length:855 start_codon:yes stop_codon:yes gene_type:complete
MGKLNGKNVIVTGASRGIGREIAKLFASEGGNIICAARTLNEGDHQFEGSLNSTVSEIKSSGGSAISSAVNISQEEECIRLFEEAHSAFGKIDILVNNAALTYFVPIKDYVVRRWKRSWEVNVHAPFILSKLALEDMIPRKSGSIINISSGAAIGPGSGPYDELSGMKGNTCYGAEKAAIERFTQGLAEEVYSEGISVSCVSPSLVVATPGTVFHNLVSDSNDTRGEPISYMAKSAYILATEPQEKVTGKVTYSQELLNEFGLLDSPVGIGNKGSRKGTGYSMI